MYIIKTMMQERLTTIYKDAQPVDGNQLDDIPLPKQPRMDVVSDGRGYVYEMQIGEYYFTRDEVSAAFGDPRITTFERVHYTPDTNKARTIGWQIPGEITEVQRMTYRVNDSTTSVFVTPQEIIDRVIQYRIEQELKLQDALEEILLANFDDQDASMEFSEDDIILSTGERFSDFAERVGDDFRIEIIDDASDNDIRTGLAQAEKNCLEVEERAKARPYDAHGLQGLLKDSFPKTHKPKQDGLFNRLLSTTYDAAQNLLERTRTLTPKQAKLIEAVAMVSALTLQFSSQTAMDIQPDTAAVTDLANANTQTSTQVETTTQTEQQAEEQRCLQSITPEQMVDIRVELFKESQFYKDNINSKDYKNRAQAIWVEIVADAVKEVWAKDSEAFKATGYRAFSSVDELFRMEIFKAYAESHGNKFKYNKSNPLVAGLYHDSIVTSRSIMKMRDLDEKYPGVFDGSHLDKSDLINARKATIIDLYIALEDHKYNSNRANGKIHEVYPLYNWYNPHINGGPTGYPLLEAAYLRPTKTDSHGRKVLKTAVDVVGRGVANDNPSIYYRTVKIYNGNEVTTAYIATLPAAAAKKVRSKRIPRSVEESLQIVTDRSQNQEGIEKIGHPSEQAVRSAALATCGLKAA